MVFNSFLKKFILFLMVFSIVFATFGCASEDSEFPDIPTPSAEILNTTISESLEQVPSQYNKLKFALPYSEETVNYLFRLYYAKSNGLFSDDDDGSSVSLSLLDSLTIPYSIESVYIPDTGISADLIQNMGDEAPDIFITNELDKCIDKGICTSLNKYSSDNKLLDADNVYVLPIMSCVKDKNLYAIPHYMSIPLIYCNVDFLPDDADPDFKISLNDLEKLTRQIGVENFETEVIPFVSAKDLIPYIASSFSDSDNQIVSFGLEEEYAVNSSEANKIFNQEVEFIDKLYEDRFSSESNEDGSDPIISRNAALWVSSSTDISYLNSYYPNRLTYMQMPVYMHSNKTVPFVTVYPICVSSLSNNKDIVADFATFISYDSDALLLIDRFEHKTGIFPVISNPTVWDNLIDDENFGYIASIYENEMNNLVCTNDVIESEIYNKLQNSILNYYKSTNESKKISLDNIYD